MLSWKDIPGWTLGIEQLYPAVVRYFDDGAVFVEIGSWVGRSAALMGQLIKESKKQIRFYTIDHGVGSPEEPKLESMVQAVGGSTTQLLTQNLQRCQVHDVVTQLTMTGAEAAKLFSDNSVDFVFIDGDHATPAVMLDIETWWPKVKSDGYLSGHDYSRASVKNAVDQFFAKLKIVIHEPQPHCWSAKKP